MQNYINQRLVGVQNKQISALLNRDLGDECRRENKPPVLTNYLYHVYDGLWLNTHEVAMKSVHSGEHAVGSVRRASCKNDNFANDTYVVGRYSLTRSSKFWIHLDHPNVLRIYGFYDTHNAQ